MKPIRNIVITRSKIFGKDKNTGGLETYLKIFCETGSSFTPILLVCGSGIYLYKNGKSKIVKTGYKTSNQYLLTLYIGLKILLISLKQRKTKLHIFSFGLSGLMLSMLKFFGLLKNINLSAILFGLEFMIQSKESTKLFTRIQHYIGLRKLLGFIILKYSDRYFTEYENHKNEYIKHFPFLDDRECICLPDPIYMQDSYIVNKAVADRFIKFNKNKEILFISVGRDSKDKRRDLSIKFFENALKEFKDTEFNLKFKICVPKKSHNLELLTANSPNIEICESLSDEELIGVRKNAMFSISHSNQKVPLLSVLEDMSWQVIPISNDSLGQSLDESCAILIDTDQKACEDIKKLIGRNKLKQKCELAFNQANKFSTSNFSKAVNRVLLINE